MTDNDRAMKNPSYDKSLLPEVRLADFLGAYCIRLNSFNTPPSSQEAKQAIVEFVTKDLFDDTQLADIDRLLGQLANMNKFAATFMNVSVDHINSTKILDDERLKPFEGMGAKSVKLVTELREKYPKEEKDGKQ